MANLSFVIVPAKVKKDGTNRVRLSVSHHSQTKYIITDVIVENNQFHNGTVVGHPHAKVMNLKLNKLMGEYLDALYSIDNPDAFTCDQLTAHLKALHSPKDVLPISKAMEYFVNHYKENGQLRTAYLYQTSICTFMEFTKCDLPLNAITPDMIKRYQKWMKQVKHYSSSSISMKTTNLRRLYNFCCDKHLCSAESPFKGVKIPKPGRRDSQISVDELRALANKRFKTKAMNAMRDLFMLSFYLGGMNLVDMFQVRYDNDCIRYQRQKTKRRTDKYTTIPILPEARAILDRYNISTKLTIGKCVSYENTRNLMGKMIKKMGTEVGITTPFMFYSARKTFIQIGVQLMIPLHILEYCCGETPKTDNPIQRYFVITKEIAGDAMRKIFDVIK